MQNAAIRRANPRARNRVVPRTARRRKKTSVWRSLLKWILLFIFLTASILIYLRQEEEISRLAHERVRLEERLSDAKAEFKSIRELSDKVGSEQYIEQIARDQLGLVRPDEIIFIH